MKKVVSLILCLLLILGLTACGASSGTNYKSEPAEAVMMTSAMGGTAEYSAEEAMADTAADATSLPENRKWIITVYMDAETEDLDAAIAAMNEQITAMDGYIEDQSIYNGSTYSSRRYRNASMTVRIPAEQVDTFSQAVNGIANVISKEKNLEDITLTYTATESRVAALETEQVRLLELLEEAQTMSDLLEIEARLTDVRYELETVTSQLRLYNNQLDYATVYLSLSEVQEYTPVEEPTLWERISGGFADSIEGLGNFFVDAFVWIIVCSPYILVFGAIAAVVLVLIRRFLRKRRPKA